MLYSSTLRITFLILKISIFSKSFTDWKYHWDTCIVFWGKMAKADVKKNFTNISYVFCQKTIRGHILLIDYRYMHLRAWAVSLVVDRETIRLAMKSMDSKWLSLRATYKLNRGKWIFDGSNEIRQLNGYYKLKPFHFAIHGCIDSLSRKII